MNPTSHAAAAQSAQFSAAVIWVNWLLLLPFLAAAVAAVYGRMRLSGHWPFAVRDLAASVAGISALTAAALLVFVPDSAWPLTADYRWTDYLFQFRLRLDRFSAVFLILLSWQFAILALTGRADSTVGPENAARRHAREAVAILAAFGCSTGALLASDMVTFAMFWQALALPVAALLVFKQQEGKEAGRPVIAFVAVHTLGSLAVMGCFGLVWTETGTTDPFAAGMSLLLRDVAALRAAAVLLLFGFACTLAVAGVLAVRPVFLTLSPVLVTLSASMMMRYLHVLFWPYVLEPISVVVLWLCAVAACGLVGTVLALRTGPVALGMLACAAAAYMLFAVAGSAIGQRAASAATAYVVGVGVGLPLLAVAGSLLRFEGRRADRSPAWSRVLGFAAVLSLAAVPGAPAFGGALLLARSLARPQLVPLLVILVSLVGFLVGGVQLFQRGRWLASSEIGWPSRLLAAVIVAVLAAGLLAWLWVPAMAQVAAHLKGVGG